MLAFACIGLCTFSFADDVVYLAGTAGATIAAVRGLVISICSVCTGWNRAAAWGIVISMIAVSFLPTIWFAAGHLTILGYTALGQKWDVLPRGSNTCQMDHHSPRAL